MILFPIAFAWLAFVVIWALRQTLEPTDGPWRPWRQRTRVPHGGPHGRRSGSGRSTRSAGGSSAKRAGARR